MTKYSILKEIFDIEGISDKIKLCPKITEEQLLIALSKSNFNLKIELSITATTLSRYLKKLFPERPNTNCKVDNYLLSKYGYKECKRCSLIKYSEEYYHNTDRNDGMSVYYKECHYKLEKPSSVYRASKYRAAKLLRTPKWTNETDLEEIRKIYNNCPEGYHVDHIVPLQGTNVSGLHVLHNLQYLLASDNISKSNKF